MGGTFELFEDGTGQCRFRLKVANRDIVASSEAYGTKLGALMAIESVRKNAPDARLDDRTE
jgi:uncharacterized protein